MLTCGLLYTVCVGASTWALRTGAIQFGGEPSRRLRKHSNACPSHSTDRKSVGNTFGSLREGQLAPGLKCTHYEQMLRLISLRVF